MADASDFFERYYTEKMWQLIPGIYRDQDDAAEPPGVLRALVSIMAAQAANLRRSNDRLWDDSFIDLCNDWAVPYLGDLVATRMVSALNLRGRRVDVAKTIYYRRRKGTPRVLEELIGDITGWEGKVVEAFRRLARPRHGLDALPAPLSGRFSGTMPGGFADLRRPFASTLLDGPFDEYSHTPDIRRPRGHDGRWNIPKLVFHVYRLLALPVRGVTPFNASGGSGFTFDPSGRDIPLFMPRRRLDDWDAWRSALPWELPAPLTCRLLGHAEYIVTEAAIQKLVASGLSAPAAADLETIRDVSFQDESRFAAKLASLPQQALLLSATIYAQLLTAAIIDDCGKSALLPGAVSVEAPAGTSEPPGVTTAGNLDAWPAAPAGKSLVIDPDRGRFLLAVPPVGPVVVNYEYGFSGPIGAGPYDRRDSVVIATASVPAGGGPIGGAVIPTAGALEIVDSASYGPVTNRASITALVIQARNFERPYLRLTTDWLLDTAPATDNTLVLDGFWLGAAGFASLVLQGQYKQVTLRHLTLDPGGTDTNGGQIFAVGLTIRGQIEQLLIDSCILGPIALDDGGLADELVIRDSIVQSLNPVVPALALPRGVVRLERVTILGAAKLERLWASETLITSAVDVVDTQDGCFRFSAAPLGSRLPHPFESQVLTSDHGLFTSQHFGQPGYAQLSQAAPQTIARGAENGSEMGAFCSLINPIKADSLAAKVEEYMPFGLIPVFALET